MGDPAKLLKTANNSLTRTQKARGQLVPRPRPSRPGSKISNEKMQMPIPDEAIALLKASDKFRTPRLRINPLTVAAAEEWTRILNGDPIADELGLVVLDDANDSNPYGLVTRGPMHGYIVHYSHDPEPVFRFANADDYLDALRECVASGSDIDDIRHGEERQRIAPAADQRALSGYVRRLVTEDQAEKESLVCMLVALFSPDRVDELSALGTHRSFFVREAVARLIEGHPRPSLLALATTLAADKHPQVRRPGERALAAIELADRASAGV